MSDDKAIVTDDAPESPLKPLAELLTTLADAVQQIDQTRQNSLRSFNELMRKRRETLARKNLSD